MVPMDLSITFPTGPEYRQSLSDLKQLLFTEKMGNSDQILASIKNADVGHEANLRFQFLEKREVPTSEVNNIFYEFQKRHKSMNYNDLFKQKDSASSFFKRRKRTKGETVYRESKPLVKNQAHPALIRESYATIMHRVMTPKIIGNNRNKKKILKSLFRFMQTAKTESFSLLPLVKQINIESILWLTIEDQELKLIFVAKLMKWMFRFFVLLICRYFIITYVKEERVFCFIKELNRDIKRDLATKIKKGLLEECSEDSINSIETRMYMVPKADGFRTITRRKYPADELKSLRKSLRVLDFLFDKYLKTPDSVFNDAYVDVTIEANESSQKYYVTVTDIRDAFGSIIQNKLFDILTALFELLPEILEFTAFYGGKNYKYGFPQFINGKGGKRVTAQKRNILAMIEKTIFNTKVAMHNKLYNVCKGVTQGSILSSKLSDIYYLSMQRKYFADFRKSGRIFSHVDDIIYITANEEFAKQFLNRVEKGIPEYNCWFKKSKIVSNFSRDVAVFGESLENTIKFLGWSIDGTTLEAEPYVKCSIRHSISYSASLDIIKLKNRLKNLESIKVKEPALSKYINSNNKILSNINVIARLQAQRCFAIANSLSDTTILTLDAIAETNNKIMKKIKKITNWTKTEQLEYSKEIRHIFWKAYYATFIKKSDLFPNLIKTFRKLTRKNNVHKKRKIRKFVKRSSLVSKRARHM